MTIAIALILLGAPPSFDDIVQANLRDISFKMTLDWFDHQELRKISRDFATTYEAKNAEFAYKEPMMLRSSSQVSGQSVLYAIVGDKKIVKVPRLGIKTTQDIARGPGKRQTLLDWGIVTSVMRDKFVKGTYIRTEPNGQWVFDIRYQYAADTSRFRAWVDPAKRAIVKKLTYNSKGELMSIFEYGGHVQIGGVWFPTKLSVTNAEGKLGGRSTISDIKVNAGIADSLFQL
jgi:outer membrane lipoprotein-sorting protein